MPQRLQGVTRNRSNVLAPPIHKPSKDLVTKEIVINDAPVAARNLLTKGQTQDEISQSSGASISTRGRYISPAEKSSGKIHERPLYLYIQAHSKHSLDLAVQKIGQIIQMEGPHHQRMPKYGGGNQTMPPSNTCVEKIMIGLEHAPPAFDLRGRLIGVGGANLHYIRNETGAMATLRGRGSMFLDPQFGQESPEPLHLYIEHLRPEGLQAARQLAKNLIETLQQELIQFQQMNPPATSIQYHTPSTVTQTSEQQIYTPQQIVQMGIPPPIIAVPPPVIQAPTVLQQQNLAQSASQIVPPPQYQAPQNSAPTPIQSAPQHSIIQHSVPIQLHPNGNVMIQQQVQTNPPTLTSINLPPPGVHIPLKSGSLVQVQAAPPMPVFSQPPPNIQLQQQPPPSQIILNQAPPNNYQYQYIQQQPQLQQNEAQQQQGHVTIQHIYQPQPQIQRIIHQNPAPQQIEQFQQIRPSQQYITLQGNTAYVVPPPNIVQQTGTSQPTPNPPNVVFSTQLPPPQSHQEITAFAGANAKPPESSGMGAMPLEERKFDSKSPEYDQNKLDRAINENAINKNGVDGPPATMNSFGPRPPVQQNTVAMTSIPIIQAPPPIMSIPPPGIHQIIGNTYLTTAPSQQDNYNATPVSIHQIQPPPQQSIHMSTVTAPTQHHVVLNHSWQPPPNQIHHIASANQIQNVQISHQIRNPGSEIIVGNQIISAPSTEVPPQHNSIITTLPPAPGMQMQFQPPAPPQQMPDGGPPPQFGEMHQIPNSMAQRMMHAGSFECSPMEKGGSKGGPKNHSPQNTCFSSENAQKQMGQMPRIGMKRKHEDETGTVSTSPKIGMGCGDFIVNVRETQKTGCPETTTSSGNANTNNTSGSPSTAIASASTYATDESKMDNGKTVNKVPMVPLMGAEGQPEQLNYSSANYLPPGQQQRYMMEKSSDFGGGGSQGKNEENYGPPPMPMRNEFRPNMRRYMGQDSNPPMLERGVMIPPPPHPGVFNRSGNYGGYQQRFRSQ
ncbi:uncharacterized protein LOC132263888 isoform X2 [Phlebotomus argentipes]|uniref:uncharacterized protein LOC132263888 isoform X2 n=1 Tax=Phlebotomus argentipes TaxID=94469 RepID=UPI002892E7CB|nr:uncharacterized protein LOC132263888 isoform X2 [Phlebotomus argentipes]